MPSSPSQADQIGLLVENGTSTLRAALIWWLFWWLLSLYFWAILCDILQGYMFRKLLIRK